jgi:DNA repair exonuclease SbcCD ATPase subunit
MKNPFTLDAIETQKSVDEDKEKVKQSLVNLDDVVNSIESLKHTRERKIDLDEAISKLQQVEVLINETNSTEIILQEKRKNVLHQITTIEEKIVKYYEQEKDITYNQQVENEISKTETDLEDVNNELDILINQINNVFGEIKVIDTNRRTILNNIKKVSELEGKYEAYQYYLDAVKRDGVPYDLITKALPTIESEVNNILAQLVDFQMLFEMDGKNINNYIVYDDDNIWPLELSSGMERFISSLAIRVGLINVSNLPRSNFLAIDEGWGTMDSDNLNSVYSLFQYLKSQFQFTLIVSHIDSMRDAVDTLLEVKKENGFSNINFR